MQNIIEDENRKKIEGCNRIFIDNKNWIDHYTDRWIIEHRWVIDQCIRKDMYYRYLSMNEIYYWIINLH
jgi:hypothetical protein